MSEIEVGKSRASGALPYVYGAGAVIVLVAVYVWLSELHHDELRLVQDGSTVRVEQGRYAPIGWETYRPTEAFKPVVIEPDIPVRAGECADLADCESRMFSVVVEQARRYLRRRERLRDATDLITQAVKLSGSTNREALLELQGDEQYVRGMLKLEDAIVVLKDARESFFRARAMDTRTFPDSEEKLAEVDQLIIRLDRLGIRDSRTNESPRTWLQPQWKEPERSPRPDTADPPVDTEPEKAPERGMPDPPVTATPNDSEPTADEGLEL